MSMSTSLTSLDVSRLEDLKDEFDMRCETPSYLRDYEDFDVEIFLDFKVDEIDLLELMGRTSLSSVLINRSYPAIARYEYETRGGVVISFSQLEGIIGVIETNLKQEQETFGRIFDENVPNENLCNLFHWNYEVFEKIEYFVYEWCL